MSITPLDTDQFTQVVHYFISVEFFHSILGNEQEMVTSQDLTEFHTFFLKQLRSHTFELSSKFEKTSTDAECALSVSQQLKSRE